MCKVEKQRLNALLFNEARAKYIEIVGSLAADKLRVAHQYQNRGMGVTKAQYIYATMEFMEKIGVLNRRYENRFDETANALQDDGDGSKEVCCLEQTCTTKGVARKFSTNVSNNSQMLNSTHNKHTPIK